MNEKVDKTSDEDISDYAIIQNSFQIVLHNIMNDKTYERFVDEYENLYKALNKSLEYNKTLVQNVTT